MSMTRRTFLWLAPLPAAAGALGRAVPAGQAPAGLPASSTFPAHEPELAREMVSVSHGNVARVRELLTSRPALANASWDWGYGDWESALGAASHVGNREIAALLIGAGAAPSLFSAAMLGQTQVVRALVTASPGVQRTRGPHGITLLAHARAGGAASAEVVEYLASLGDADPRYTSQPLAEADRAAVTGTYVFGAGVIQRLLVTSGERGLSIQRQGDTARGLTHLGDRLFHPLGAVAVRIQFAAGERSASVTITDGPTVVTATRAGGG